MPVDFNPVVPADRSLIQSYGDGRFRISGEVAASGVIVLADTHRPWSVTAPGDITTDALKPILDIADDLDILLIGCGPTFVAVPKGLRAALKEAGIVLEWMDTGAACRTFNVLIAEERRVAAALIAVD